MDTFDRLLNFFERAQSAGAVERPLFLTLREASRYTGLRVTFLRKLIDAGALHVLRDGTWKVRRSDLENLDPSRLPEMRDE